MKKVFILSVILSLGWSALIAQIDTSALLFTTVFYLEDARGNRDTVYISASSQANGVYNPELGEVNLQHIPFDSVLEARLVRVIDVFDLSHAVPYMYKHAIGRIESQSITLFCRWGITDYSIAVHNKYPPLKVSWDSTFYASGGTIGCWRAAFLTNSFQHSLNAMGWYLETEGTGIDWACLAEESEHVFYPFPLPYYFDESSFIQHNIYSGNSFRYDTIAVFNFDPGGGPFGDKPCDGTVSTRSELQTLSFDVFPNPAQGELRLRMPAAHERIREVSVYDGRGAIAAKMSGINGGSVDVSGLPPGSYFLKVLTQSGRVGVRRFVKL